MNNNNITHGSWLIYASIFGAISLPSYFLSAVFVIPYPAFERALFFIWGPTFALGIYCLGQWMRRDFDSIPLRLAVMMNVGAGLIVTMMATVQLLNSAIIVEKIKATTDEEKISLYKAAFLGTNNTQLGFDIAFDIWISLGTALFALALTRFFILRPWLGIIGAIFALGSLINNMIYFPWPPADKGGIDFGPVIGIWWGVVLAVIAFHHWQNRQTEGP